MVELSPPLPASATDATELQALIASIVERVRLRLTSQRTLGATYRLQFHDGVFGFEEGKAIVPYLRALGVSHVYASPCLQARQGSSHGYDVVDHGRINENLGGEGAFESMIAALHAQGMGLILDIVPNHMCVTDPANGWWMDVLASGAASPFATYFDIDWHPVKRELDNKVLLPVLGESYGEFLEQGDLEIRFEEGAFFATRHGMRWPLDPKTWKQILAPGLNDLIESLPENSSEGLELQSILTALEHLPDRTETGAEQVAERWRERIVIQGRLQRLCAQSPTIAAHIETNLQSIRGTAEDPASLERLHELLDAQAYRLSFWRAGSDELNYRRFFDITDLAALSMENIEVFDAAHDLLIDMTVRQWVDGFRIDHVDGLFNPERYLWRLQWSFLRALGRDAFQNMPAGQAGPMEWNEIELHYLKALELELSAPEPQALLSGQQDAAVLNPALHGMDAAAERLASTRVTTEGRRAPLFVVVEKILGPSEPLPNWWPVEGTTGYEFANHAQALFIDGAGWNELTRTYVRFANMHASFDDIVYDCKRLILNRHMQSEVQLLASRLDRLSERHWRTRDYTLLALRWALQEIIACFTVYRTYVQGDQIAERDRQIIQTSIARARRRNPMIPGVLFDFVRDVLLGSEPRQQDGEGERQRRFFVGRFQQVTSPVMAKGFEDTALYRYLPLVSLNEVGGHPTEGGGTVEDFHRSQRESLQKWPYRMISSMTHDTKRSEDVRARISVLSEAPGLWRKAVQRWSRWNRRHRREIDGESAPSRNDEWLLYQTLVGIWPVRPPDPPERDALIQRVQQYMEKATHEAKLRTSWINPHPGYDRAVREFIAEVLSDPSHRFCQDLETLSQSLLNAGLLSSLSQVLLKLTAPGVPDIYQGQEFWDFSLVDPDNRRPVDYDVRGQLLAELIRSDAVDRRSLARSLALVPRDDRLKLFVTWRLLQFRQRWQSHLTTAEYLPLQVHGEAAGHVCAFARRVEIDGELRLAVVVAPRLIHKLLDGTGQDIPCGAAVWHGTMLSIPAREGLPLRNEFTGQLHQMNSGSLSLDEVFDDFPLGLLVHEPAAVSRSSN